MGLFRRIRKLVKDVGSGAKDIFENNPEALMIGAAMFGLPYLTDKMGKTGGGGFLDLAKKFGTGILGQTQKVDPFKGVTQEGGGILGIGQGLLKGLTGGKGIEGNAGLLSLIASIMAKKAFEKEKEGPLSKEDRLSEIDLKYNDITGGPQRATDRFRGLHFDPVTDTSYDVKEYDVAGNKYKDFEVDADGNIIDPNRRPSLGINDGGIVGLQAGGNPFMNRGTMRGSLGGGMPGGADPTVEGIMGYNPNVVRRARGGTTAGDLADTLEDNPGISQFFPRKFGMIHGPGGPKEDKIPAMLSDGEFVMTAKAVDNAGGPKSMYNLMNRLDPDSSRGRGIV